MHFKQNFTKYEAALQPLMYTRAVKGIYIVLADSERDRHDSNQGWHTSALTLLLTGGGL